MATTGLQLFARSASASTYVWNNTGSTWETAGDWTSGGPPTSADIASFDPTASGTTVTNPTINGADAALTLSLNNNGLGGTYSLGGSGSLAVGSGGVLVRGYGTQTITGPTLTGAATGNLAFNIGNGASLVLSGATTATTNPGLLFVDGGSLTVDNSASTTVRLAANPVTLTGSATLSVLGNSAGTTVALGNLSAGSNVVSGLNLILVTPNGGSAKVSFSDGTAGAGFSLRPGTRASYEFAAGSGVLGDPNGAQITFTGTPFQSSTGLLATSAGGTTLGFGIVKDSAGVNFATYNQTNGVVSVASAYASAVAVPVQTTSAPASGTSANVQFNPTGAVNTAANASGASIRISPTGAGASLNLTGTTTTTNALATTALMLDGPYDFSITGTGTFGNSGTRYIYVNNPTTTLSISQIVDSGSNPTVFAGPGIVALTGAGSQNTNTDTSRFSIAGGVVRGNNTQIGFKTGVTTGGVISFGGGVLEITGGTNGSGTSADFTRALGTTGGSVTWGGLNGAEAGSGGFSAFGAAASVNIGGASGALTWNTLNFVPDGAALKFGSVVSNAVLTFQNPIALDGGTAGAYAAREVNVTAGAGGDKTVLSGVVSGSSSSDLIKTGTGTLVLGAAETYAGRTMVDAGTVAVTTGLAGPVVVASGGTITAGSGNGSTASDSVSTATTGPQTWVAGGTYLAKVAGTSGSAVSTNDQLTMNGLTLAGTGTFAITVGALSSTGGTLSLPASGSVVIADDTLTTGVNPFNATPAALATAFTLSTPGLSAPAGGGTYQLDSQPDGTGGYDLIVDVATAATPEPTSLLLAGIAAVPLVVGRRRRSGVASA